MFDIESDTDRSIQEINKKIKESEDCRDYMVGWSIAFVVLTVLFWVFGASPATNTISFFTLVGAVICLARLIYFIIRIRTLQNRLKVV